MILADGFVLLNQALSKECTIKTKVVKSSAQKTEPL